MFTGDFSKAPRAARGSYLFFGGTKYSGFGAIIQLIFVWTRVIRRMKASPGYLGHFIWYGFPFTFGNFSLWDSKQNMMAFARSPEHRAAIRWLVQPRIGRGAFIRFFQGEPAGHTLGQWRAEYDPNEDWRNPRFPFSSGTFDPHAEINAKQ